jgi:O-acetyl-ADP-ribose deacetylase (regulator of RNase III)
MQAVSADYTRVSIETADRIANQLSKANLNVEFRLQGSVPLDVHIKGKLPNKYVIHARAGHYLHEDDAEAHLESAYRSALTLAAAHNIQSVAIPAMGVGVFKFPLELASEITARVLRSPEWDDTSLKWVRLCVSDEHIKAAYLTALT